MSPRLISRERSLELLGRARIGRIVSVGPGGEPMIRPINFWLDQHLGAIVFRTTDGAKRRVLLARGRATFEVDGVTPEFDRGWCVIVSGTIEEVRSEAESERLSREHAHPWLAAKDTHWMVLWIRAVSGREVGGAVLDDADEPPEDAAPDLSSERPQTGPVVDPTASADRSGAIARLRPAG